MRDAVHDRNGWPRAMLGFSTAAWKLAPRDSFLGWTAEKREKNLPLIRPTDLARTPEAVERTCPSCADGRLRVKLGCLCDLPLTLELVGRRPLGSEAFIPMSAGPFPLILAPPVPFSG